MTVSESLKHILKLALVATVAVIFLFLIAVLTNIPAFCQTQNTQIASQFPGTNAGAKIAAAQSACNPSMPTCIIIIGPELGPGAYSQGTDPLKCSTCVWIDYRNPATAGSGSASYSSLAVFNVRNPSYGAKGNGVADDAPAVQAATNAAIAAGGGTIYFPPGSYYLNTLQTSPYDGIINVAASHLHYICETGAVLTVGNVQSGGVATTLFHLGYPATNVNQASGYSAQTIAGVGAASITLNTPSQASNFVAGDVIYLRGANGQDGQPFGEYNYVETANATTGVITLTRPLALPYATVLTAVKATPYIYIDNSIENCEVHSPGDFSFIGQVVGVKIRNNRFYTSSGATRGAFVNSYQPLSDIEIAGNYFQGDPNSSSFFIQVATGWSNFRITNNVVQSGALSPLEITEGASNGQISGNSIFAVGSANTALSFCQYAYSVQVSNNVFSQNGATGTNGAVTLSCSSGAGVNSSFSNNTVILANSSSAAIGGSPSLPIVGNTITTSATGINPGSQSTVIAGNTIHLTGSSGYGIFSNSGTPNLAITGNYIYADSAGTQSGVQITNGSATTVVGNTFTNLQNAVAPQWQSTITSLGNTCIGVTNASGTCHDVFGLSGAVWAENALLINGNFTFSSDNANDIGASGANRPRHIYVGTDVKYADGTAQSTALLRAALTTTAATSDNLTVTGVTSSGRCWLEPTNSSAATNLATTYVSAKTTNQITVTHTATSGMTYDVGCTAN